MAHAVVYAWLDPATGAREKICTRPYADGYFHNYYDGRIYYTGNFRNADTPGQQAALLYFDTADGTEKTLLETIPFDTYGIDVCAPFSPAFAGVPQRYLRVQNAGDANADCLLDMETGDVLPAPTVTAEGVRRPALLLACTASGQWLTTANPATAMTRSTASTPSGTRQTFWPTGSPPRGSRCMRQNERLYNYAQKRRFVHKTRTPARLPQTKF